jgi:hypothetical protein
MARILSLAVVGLLFSLPLTAVAQEADSPPTLTPPPATNAAPATPYTPVPSTTISPSIQYQRSLPPSGMPVVPPPPGFAPAFPPNVIQPATPFAIAPSLGPQRPRATMSEHYVVPAKIQFNDGTTLTGELHSDSPLQCVALFGQTAIPFNQIKGLEWRTQTNDQGETEAKVAMILVNGDALTVTNVNSSIHLKTTWGEATVELLKVRSVVITNEKVKWADTPAGRALVPDDAK